MGLQMSTLLMKEENNMSNFILAVFAVFALALTACSDKDEDTGSDTGEAAEEETE